jgi:hypothetical protein
MSVVWHLGYLCQTRDPQDTATGCQVVWYNTCNQSNMDSDSTFVIYPAWMGRSLTKHDHNASCHWSIP